MNTITHRLRTLLGCAVALLLLPGAASAQLPSASAAQLGLGGGPVATVRGITSIATNPAGLARSPGFSLSVVPVNAGSGIDPITLADLADFSGDLIPASTRSEWLSEIEAEGGQSGRIDVGVSPFAATIGSVGFQLGVTVASDLLLNPDAAELLLFGNAGRTGEPQDFALSGSSMDAFAITTAALAWGFEVNDNLSLGVTGKYHIGNAVLLGRDAGSAITSDPIEVDVTFPLLMTSEDSNGTDGGSGFGVDVGALFHSGDWTFGGTVRNLINTFEWDVDELAFRPGRALFDGTNTESDLDELPGVSAPAVLQTALEDATLAPEIQLGAAWHAVSDLVVTADLRNRFGDGIDFGPDFSAGLGAEYSGLGFLPIRGHAAVVTDGFQFGGGASLVLGPAHISYGVSALTGDLDDAVLGSFSISFGAR